jgi:hypothetical protein
MKAESSEVRIAALETEVCVFVHNSRPSKAVTGKPFCKVGEKCSKLRTPTCRSAEAACR